MKSVSSNKKSSKVVTISRADYQKGHIKRVEPGTKITFLTKVTSCSESGKEEAERLSNPVMSQDLRGKIRNHGPRK